MRLSRIDTSTLSVAFYEDTTGGGREVLLMHGFPYSPWAYDEVAGMLVADGYRVVVPYLRGFGTTTFHDAGTPRSGEQAALCTDVVEIIERLDLDRPIVVGYDWGGRAACSASATRPDLVGGLVTGGGYNIFGKPVMGPRTPESEHRRWYEYYLHMHRGRMMLESHRREFCRFLWSLWSPAWRFSDATFERNAVAFDNPDFVEVVLHSYRHRAGLVPGDQALEDLAALLETQPTITVPSIALYREGRMTPDVIAQNAQRFTDLVDQRSLPGVIGHNLPHEAPAHTADAVRRLAAN